MTAVRHTELLTLFTKQYTTSSVMFEKLQPSLQFAVSASDPTIQDRMHDFDSLRPNAGAHSKTVSSAPIEIGDRDVNAFESGVKQTISQLYTKKRLQRGTGPDLSIVHDALHGSQGFLEFRSDELLGMMVWDSGTLQSGCPNKQK
jgi:hypothetical protein